MTWTYDLKQLATSPLYQVRLAIGDTIAADQQLQDEEIDQNIADLGNVWSAAAMCCRNLAAQYARLVSQKSGQSALNWSDRSKAYAAMAENYEARAAAMVGAAYAAGTSVTDMQRNQENQDLVQPVFSIGIDDSFLPVSPVEGEGVSTRGQTGG